MKANPATLAPRRLRQEAAAFASALACHRGSVPHGDHGPFSKEAQRLFWATMRWNYHYRPGQKYVLVSDEDGFRDLWAEVGSVIMNGD